jgi:K+-sensing histidine kinase KdpD
VIAALAAPLALAAVMAAFRSRLPDTDAALVLVAVIVAVAANGFRAAGVLAAVSAAAWFDFFLTRPYESFDIDRRPALETTFLLLVIGVAVTELAVRGRREHGAAGRRAGYLAGIAATAAAMAGGRSPAGLTDEVARQLTRLLGLRGCVFQYGMIGLGGPARLERDGTVRAARQVAVAPDGDWPRDGAVELLVERGGVVRGRFLMTPGTGAAPGREQRLIAVALADQAGAASAGQELAGR